MLVDATGGCFHRAQSSYTRVRNSTDEHYPRSWPCLEVQRDVAPRCTLYSRAAIIHLATSGLHRSDPHVQARLEELSKEVKELADRNRALLKDEAAARSAAESGRYQAAAATAERERAETDRKLMEDRLAVMEARSEDERDRHARLEKKMQVMSPRRLRFCCSRSAYIASGARCQRSSECRPSQP